VNLVAHCVKKIPKTWTLKSVRIGERNLETEVDCSPDDGAYCAPPSINVPVVQITLHENYIAASRDQYFDIALLRLSTKVEFNDFVQPICLPLDSSLWTKDFNNHTFDVAGLSLNIHSKHLFIFRFFDSRLG
jgi:hypothetical protein